MNAKIAVLLVWYAFWYCNISFSVSFLQKSKVTNFEAQDSL